MSAAVAQYLHAAKMVFFSKRVTAGGRVFLAATPDAEAFLFLPEGTLLVASDPLQLLLHAHSGPATLPSTQLLLHRTAWTFLLARADNHRRTQTPQRGTDNK